MPKNKYNPYGDEISNKIASVDKIDELSRKMDNMRMAEYIEMMSNPKRVIFMN